jgi:hypothetical protein
MTTSATTQSEEEGLLNHAADPHNSNSNTQTNTIRQSTSSAPLSHISRLSQLSKSTSAFFTYLRSFFLCIPYPNTSSSSSSLPPKRRIYKCSSCADPYNVTYTPLPLFASLQADTQLLHNFIRSVLSLTTLFFTILMLIAKWDLIADRYKDAPGLLRFGIGFACFTVVLNIWAFGLVMREARGKFRKKVAGKVVPVPVQVAEESCVEKGTNNNLGKAEAVVLEMQDLPNDSEPSTT